MNSRREFRLAVKEANKETLAKRESYKLQAEDVKKPTADEESIDKEDKADDGK